MSATIYIGIDPGASGGIAAIEPDCVFTSVMPKTEQDVWSTLAGITHTHAAGFPICAYIEKVSGYIGNAHPGNAMFKFGHGYGSLRMALTAAGIPFDEIPPRTWQKALGISPRKKTESKTVFKNRIKQKAQQLFPQATVTLAVCDALLIAEYCRRKHEGKL